jgi:hypothetical protein
MLQIQFDAAFRFDCFHGLNFVKKLVVTCEASVLSYTLKNKISLARVSNEIEQCFFLNSKQVFFYYYFLFI